MLLLLLLGKAGTLDPLMTAVKGSRAGLETLMTFPLVKRLVVPPLHGAHGDAPGDQPQSFATSAIAMIKCLILWGIVMVIAIILLVDYFPVVYYSKQLL